MQSLERHEAPVENFEAEKGKEVHVVVNEFQEKYGALRAGIDEVSLKNITTEQVEIGGVTYLKNNEGNLVRLDSLTQEGFANISKEDKEVGGMHTHTEWEKQEGITHSEFKDYYGEDFVNLQNLIKEYSENFYNLIDNKGALNSFKAKLNGINSENLDTSGKKQYSDMQKYINEILSVEGAEK